jgi:hypothetical protein
MREMKKIGIVIMGLLIALASTTVVAAVPRIPESYWGYATVDGVPAALDTLITVEVYETGEVVGDATVIEVNGLYSLHVLFDDSETPEDEGANDGDNLTWKINGMNCNIPAPGADTALSGGTNDNFHITASHPPPPAPAQPPWIGGGAGSETTPTPAPIVPPTPTATPTATPTPRITPIPTPTVLGTPVYVVSYAYLLLVVLFIIIVVVGTMMLLRRKKKRRSL